MLKGNNKKSTVNSQIFLCVRDWENIGKCGSRPMTHQWAAFRSLSPYPHNLKFITIILAAHLVKANFIQSNMNFGKLYKIFLGNGSTTNRGTHGDTHERRLISIPKELHSKTTDSRVEPTQLASGVSHPQYTVQGS